MSLQHTADSVLLQAQMHSTYLWGLSYRPFGTGAFNEQKISIFNTMLARETAESCVPFQLVGVHQAGSGDGLVMHS